MFKDKEKLPRRVHFKWVGGDPASVDAMRKAGLEKAQALIIGGSSSAPPKEADAYTLTTITLAQARRPSCLLLLALAAAIKPSGSAPMRTLIFAIPTPALRASHSAAYTSTRQTCRRCS